MVIRTWYNYIWYGIMLIILLFPSVNFGAINPTQDITTYKQASSQNIDARAWKFAQQYHNGERIRSRSAYAAFAKEVYQQSGLRLIPWDYYFTTSWDKNCHRKSERRIYADKTKRAGIRKELAVKISAVYRVMKAVYHVSPQVGCSMIRTHRGKRVKNSMHLVQNGNRAIDTHIPSNYRDEFIRLASNVGFTGIGAYGHDSKQVHVDTGKRRIWFWDANNKQISALLSAHKKHVWYPPAKVLAYLGISKDVALYTGNADSGITQYSSSQEALQGMVSEYRQAHPEVGYSHVEYTYTPFLFETLPQMTPEELARLQTIGGYVYYLVYIQPRQRQRAFIVPVHIPDNVQKDVSYTVVEVTPKGEQANEQHKKHWYSFLLQ